MSTDRSRSRLFIGLALFTVAGLCATSGAGASNTYVALTGAHIYPFTNWATAATNIQAAVDACAAGGRVWVSNGTYAVRQQILVTNGVRVVGTGAPADVVVDADGCDRCFRLGNAGAALENVTLVRGSADYGGGVYVASNGTVRNCVVSNCWAEDDGGGVYIAGSGLVTGCLVVANEAHNGGGLYLAGGGRAENCEISWNRSENDGGGVYCEAGGSLVASVISNNAGIGYYAYGRYFGSAGGGVRLDGGGVVSNCLIIGNQIEARAYSDGGGVSADGAASRVQACRVIANTITVYGDTAGGAGVEVWDGAQVANCVVLSNAVLASDASWGGGISCGGDAIVRNCLVVGNSLSSSYGTWGGGIYCWSRDLVQNCTASGNAAEWGGGLYLEEGGTVENSIFYFNTATFGAEYYAAGNTATGIAWCCTRPEVDVGMANITNDPQFVAPASGDYHLGATSACLDVGVNRPWMYGAPDLDGTNRILNGVVDLGAYERPVAGFTCAFEGFPRQAWDALTVTFTAHASGPNTNIVWYGWDLDGDGTWDRSGPGLRVVTNTYGPGDFDVRLALTNSAGQAATCFKANYVCVFPSLVHVSPAGSHQHPFATWSTAATNIPAAVGAARNGATVLIANGTYRLVTPVTVTRAVTIQGLSREGVVVDGQGARRCFYLDNPGIVLDSLTITNGYAAGDWPDSLGGGIYLSTNATVRNCVITGCRAVGSSGCGGGAYLAGGGLLRNCLFRGNSADMDGGGVYLVWGGVLQDCVITNNTANSGGGVRCDWGGTLSNCTIVANSGAWGGGVNCYRALLWNCTVCGNVAPNGSGAGICGGGGGSVVRNCTITGNTASGPDNGSGGGIFVYEGDTVENCFVSRNSAVRGGGLYFYYGGVARGCTVTGNSADEDGGGIACYGGGELRNCVVYYNRAPLGANWRHVETTGSYAYCAITPHPGGRGNITAEPGLASPWNPHLLASAACINAGTNAHASGVDIDGEGRTNGTVDIGCDEFWPAGMTGQLAVAILAVPTNACVGYPVAFQSDVAGRAIGLRWQFGDGGTVFDACAPSHAYGAPGVYPVVLVASNLTHSATATALVSVVNIATNYVALSGSNVPPFITWANAATTIQAAVDVAVPGGLVMVSNGTFALNATVTVTNPVTLKSLNGASATVLNGRGLYRCLQLAHPGATVDGFTISNGYVSGNGGGVLLYGGGTLRNCVVTRNSMTAGKGAGVYCYGGGTVANCAIVGNFTDWYAGGVALYGGGQVLDSLIMANNAGDGAGAYAEDGGILKRCTNVSNVAVYYGGGVYLGTGGRAERCVLKANTAGYGGGGAYCSGGILENCLVVSNTASGMGAYQGGGGVRCGGGVGSVVQNCTIAGNHAVSDDGGGLCLRGAWGSTIRNNIIYFNTATTRSNYYHDTTYNVTYSCMAPLLSGAGNTAGDPLFAGAATGDYHLASGSPCVDTGTASGAPALDLDGVARPLDGNGDGTAAFDMGAYERVAAGADSDRDGMKDADEILAGTDPTDPASFLGFTGILRLAPASVTGVVVRWQSVAGRSYRLERGTNLLTAPPFPVNVRTNITATPPLNTETDTTAVGTGPYYYRIKLE